MRLQLKERGWEEALYLLLGKHLMLQLTDQGLHCKLVVFDVVFKLRPGDGLASKVIVHIKLNLL